MAKQTSTFRQPFYNGTHGNLATETLKAVLNDDPADTEFEIGVLPAGVEVISVESVFDALGVGTSLEFGYRYKNADHGSDELAYWGSINTAAAGSKKLMIKPKRFDNQVVMVATLKGGAGTGEAYILPMVISRGNA